MRASRLFARPVVAGLTVAIAAAATHGALCAETATAERLLDVEAYDVDGAKLLAQEDIEAAVYPFLGPGRTKADVDHAREALEKAYHDRGYQTVVVEIPAQSVSDNIVRLHVIEAPIGRLRVTGSRYYSPEAVRREASALQEGETPDIGRAQRQITELNRLPDRRVTPLLRAGVAPGTVDVDLKVSDTLPLHGSVEITNDHNQGTEPLRLLATVHYDNLWQLGHSLSLTYAVAPVSRADSEIFAGSYLAPLWNTPWSLLLYGYNSNSDVASLGGTTVLGKGYAIGVRGILQLPSRGDITQSLSFGLDFKNFDENVNFAPTGGTGAGSTTSDTVQYVPLNAVYNIRRDGAKTTTAVSVGLTAGVRGLGSDSATVDFKRSRATANFVHLNLDLTQTEALGRGFEAAQRLSGQLADQPLVSSEQFSAGGLTSVRGYLQSEVVGDDGFSGALELRAPSTVPKFARTWLDEVRFYAFSDGAILTILHPLAEQQDFFALASAGLGVRFGLLKHLKGEVAVAVPFLSGAATHADRPRATFSLKSEF